MRRLSVVPVLALGLLLTAFGTPGHTPAAAAATTAGADIAPVPAVPADSVVDSYGVGIHLAFLDTPYRDATAVADALGDLGVRHVRDDLFMDNPRQYAGIKTVADRGIRFDLIMGNPLSPDPAVDYVKTVASQLPAGSVESLEGTNEWDLSGRDDWVTEMQTRQQQLYRAAKADPATAGLPVLAPALAFPWNYEAAGDLSQNADLANAHMYPGGYRPSNQIPQITRAVRGSNPDQPLVVTEAGYHNALNTDNGHRPVPEDVAGVYLPRLLLEHHIRGTKRLYTYELIDEFDDPDATNPEAHFGLLRRDLSPKPAYTAMQALLGLLADPGPAFTPGSLPVTVDGFPSDARYVLTQKRTGQFVLLLWRDVAIYDPEQQVPVVVEPTKVTLRLGTPADLKVYRPSQGGASPVVEAEGSSLPLQLDGQVTAITIDEQAATPSVPTRPRIVSAKAGRGSVAVTWRRAKPRGKAVTAYKLAWGTRTLKVGPEVRTARLTGLPKGRELRVAVRARNAVGWGKPDYTRYVTTRR